MYACTIFACPQVCKIGEGKRKVNAESGVKK